MATKLNIMGLKTLDGSTYTVGEALSENNDLVIAGIRYNRPDVPYNKGFQLNGGSYTISIQDNEAIRILIPQPAVASLAIVREKTEETPNPEAIGLGE